MRVERRWNPRPICECCGKASYRSERAARTVADERERKERKPLRVYYEWRCCSFHITSKEYRP